MLKADVFVRDQISPQLWPHFVTVLRTAYAAADDVIRDTPILQVKSAEDNKGRIIQWAVDFGLERAVEIGTLSCDCRWRPFAKPTGRYLELRFEHSRLTISQVENPKKQPRNVVFRDNARLGNGQGGLFEDEKTDSAINDLPHILLVHGHQTLNFAHLAVPSPSSQSSYLWRSSNLLNVPHEVPAEGPAAEDTDYDLNEMKLLKERIEKWRKDNGEG